MSRTCSAVAPPKGALPSPEYVALKRNHHFGGRPPQPEVMKRCDNIIPEKAPQTSFGAKDMIPPASFFAPGPAHIHGSCTDTCRDIERATCSPAPVCYPCKNALCYTLYNGCCPCGKAWDPFCKTPWPYCACCCLGACVPLKQCTYCCVCCDPTTRCASLVFWAQRIAIAGLWDAGEVCAILPGWLPRVCLPS